MASDLEARGILYSADEVERLFEQRKDLAASAWDKASTYDTVVTLAGFGAFFALWSQVAGDVTQTTRMVAVVAMGLSVFLYVGWHLLVMVARHAHDRQLVASTMKNQPADEAFLEWDRIAREQRDLLVSLQRRLWMPVFGSSVALGVSGAATLIYNCAAVMFGWPQLTGRW